MIQQASPLVDITATSAAAAAAVVAVVVYC
jgi:hypothetical protein